MSLNTQQQRAASYPGSVAVQAGPGTGKTLVLSYRYLHHISPGSQANGQGFSPLQIVALTFTEAAANELRQRVIKRVRENLADQPQLLAEIQAATITTFHAFCQKIIREFPQEAGVPAVFEIIDADQDFSWSWRQINRLLARLPRKDVLALGVGRLRTLGRAYLRDPLELVRAAQTVPPGEDPQLYAIVQRVVGFLDEQYSALKRARRRLEYSDLERAALKALESPEVRQIYRQRYPVFLVDEFQDTNPVQAELLGLLQSQILTIVGDPQQSIYGFRGADPTIFGQWTQQIGNSVSLTTTYRFHCKLGTYFNHVFSRLLTNYLPMLEFEPTAQHQPHHVRVIHGQGDSKYVADQRRKQAEQIAQEIMKLKAEIPHLNYADIAVLAPTWESLKPVARALEKAGIPIAEIGGDDLLQTLVARDVISLLGFVANPHDNLHLVSLLRSPFFGLTDAQIDRLAPPPPGQPRPTFWSTLPQLPGFEAVSPILHQLLAQADGLSPVRILRLADRLTGYTAVLAGINPVQGSINRDLADWRGLLQWVGEQGWQPPANLLRTLQQMQQDEVNLPRPPLEGGDVVHLSSMHAAKGLEWEVVFLADLSRKSPNDLGNIFLSRDAGIALKDQSKSKGDNSDFFLQMWDREKAAREDGDRRLLYVAMTRAKQRLYLVGNAGKNVRFWQLLGPHHQEWEKTTQEPGYKYRDCPPPDGP